MNDFAQLAQEYLTEAETIQKRITALKAELRTASSSQSNELNRRIAILYTMYLECRHTGRLLAAHPATLREQAELGGDSYGNQVAQL